MQNKIGEKKKKEKKKKKKGKENYPQIPRALDAISVQGGFYLCPITHKHPNVTLSLELLLSSM